MRYIIDSDLHIHSHLSLCSEDPLQTPEAILEHAKNNGLKYICLTDHFWDELAGECCEEFYWHQGFAHISECKPLPQAEGITFAFGCETDFDHDLRLGVSEERMDEFSFIIVPLNHFHFRGFSISAEDYDSHDPKRVADCLMSRFHGLLDKNLPFEKIGIAHLTDCLTMWYRKNFADHIDVCNAISDKQWHDAFTRAAEKGVGIELNFVAAKYSPEQLPDILRVYRIAKECGCKFYFGSDAHTRVGHAASIPHFNAIVDLLDLKESDKFLPAL